MSLSPGQNVYFHLNHPIRYVQLVGPITSIDEKHPKLGTITIDDGSGATLNVKINRLAPEIVESIDCPSNTEVDNVNVKAGIGEYTITVDGEELDVSSVVKVKGTISTFRDVKQLELKRIWVVRTTNEEAAFWSQLAKFKQETLSLPWVLDDATRLKHETDRKEGKRKEWERKQAYHKKWEAWRERTKVQEDKREQRRRKEEVMMNAGALPGSNVLTVPWNTGN